MKPRPATRDPAAWRTAARVTRCSPIRFTAEAKTSGAASPAPPPWAGRWRPSPVTMARSPNVREVAPVPSADDRLADVPPSADPVRQREPDPIVAQLQERMERLPHGHPSSPYNDDGSRKPLLPDLSKYELPIPGDPDYRPEPSRAPEADGPEIAQASDRVTLGNNPDEGPERTSNRTELWEVRPDDETVTDAEDPEHVQEVRERLDQAPAPSLAPDEEDTPDARGEASQQDGGTSHDAPADDLDERLANELPLSGDPDYQPDLPRASEADDTG